MKNADVKSLQLLLKDQGLFNGKVDGIYGPVTAASVKQSKWWFGYPKKNVDTKAGNLLIKYLTGQAKPNLLMRQRSKSRGKIQGVGDRALLIGLPFVGLTEDPPNSNKVLFSDWYGMRGPWCLMFVTYCFVKAGSKAFIKGQRWAYVPYLLADAKARRNGVTVVPPLDADEGDLALFGFKMAKVPGHIGILLSRPDTKGSFKSLEGNTSPTSNANGGAVMIRDRQALDVIAFVRVFN